MRITIFIVALLLNLTAIAGVEGVVISVDGEPLVGASVRWIDEPIGTKTDYDGKFKLNYNVRNRQLITSYVGFTTDTTFVANDSNIVEITLSPISLGEVTVTSRGRGVVKVSGAENSLLIGQAELFKAACCNLGESFTTNPSVDVSYDDAATGAKQIKLLGLSGSYVQMLTENIPAFRGAAHPFSLGYVPGPWMQSIQVSKGSSSVKNGYESITGQINIEYLKPQAEDEIVEANLYGDTKAKFEANFDGNIHITDKLSTALLFHYEDRYKNHDGNGDGFIDMPDVRQFNVMNRWGYFSSKRITQALVSVVSEQRTGGVAEHSLNHLNTLLYNTNLNTTNVNTWLKNAWILNQDKNTNIAIIGNFTRHLYDGKYGDNRSLYTKQTNVYAQLLFETDFNEHNSISVGGNFVYDRYNHMLNRSDKLLSTESTIGGYAQYTYKLGETFVAMAGIRYDHSDIYKSFVTPRAHIKWAPMRNFTLRASAGKGYRSVNPWAEYSYSLASSLPIIIESDINQEKAWNYGISASYTANFLGKPMTLSAEYYYTDFECQVISDRDSRPGEILIGNLHGKSYSHTFQIDFNYELIEGFTFTAAYRRNDVNETYSGVTMQKPLTAKYKCLASFSYLTPLELWQFDLTLQITGDGRLPKSPDIGVGTLYNEKYPAFAQLSGQITRHFRNFSLYLGGENLTNYKQPNPIVNVPDVGYYDPTLIWGPLHGVMVYAGIRLKFNYR